MGWSSFSGCPANPVLLRKTATSAPDIHAYPQFCSGTDLRRIGRHRRVMPAEKPPRKANRNSPQRRPRRNTGTSKAEAPLRTDTGILRPHRPQTPYPHRYAPNKESSPPVKTINRYLRPQSFRPLPDRPFPAKKYIPPIPTHCMDTRQVNRPPSPPGSKSITEIPKRIIFSVSGTLLPE